ncbi:MAG: DUF58 domain-containing protein [Pseudomonadota bacterium]
MSDLESTDVAGAGLLRRDSEKVSGSLPPLLVEAQQIVNSLAFGVHGRRRSGVGETFWQYRQAEPGDSLSDIDWRRSAGTDQLYVRETEWEAAESVVLWCDQAQSMAYKSSSMEWTKADRARLLTMASAVLLNRGGERFGLFDSDARNPRGGETQLLRIATLLGQSRDDLPDFGAPPGDPMPKAGKAVFFSDFMGPRDAVFPALLNAAGQGTGGVFVMILDPVEEDFPFRGRTRFQSIGRTISHETDQAASLRAAYLERLEERRADLANVAARAGWQLLLHRTDESPRRPLVKLHGILGGAR